MSNCKVTDPGSTASLYSRERLAISGKDRLYKMFSLDETGSFSSELISSCQAAFVGAFIGATYGGFVNTKDLGTAVAARNQPASGLHVKSAPGDGFVSRFIRGGVRWGWRAGLFCGSLMLISTATSVYRGKSGVLEYVLAGGVLGTACTVNLGVRAMALGGCVGVGIGTLGGGAAYAIQKLNGTTTEESRFWQYGWKESQLKHSVQEVKRLREEHRQLVKQEHEQEQSGQTNTSPVVPTNH